MRPAATVPRWPRPDFVAPAPRGRWPALALLAVALTWFGVSATEAWRVREAARDAADARRHWESRRSQTSGPARASASPRGAAPADTGNASAQRVHAALHFPWSPLLRTLEGASSPEVQWLVLDIDRAGQALALEGLAPDAAQALARADALAARAGFAGVLLTRLGAAEPGAGQRFALRAQVRPAGLAP